MSGSRATIDSQNEQMVQMPLYLTRFACIGPACEDNCCSSGWQVPVDAATLARYEAVDDPELTPLLRSKVVNTSPEQREHLGAAHIEMETDGCCPFLSSERWCRIHERLGERLLSITCTGFPRVANEIDGLQEWAATLSCPEVARLALLAPDAMDTVVVAQEPRRMPSRSVATTFRERDDPRAHFQAIRAEVFALLRRRDVSIEGRLVALGLALRKLSTPKLSAAQVTQVFTAYGGNVDAIEEQVGARAKLRSAPMVLLQDLVSGRAAVGVKGARYAECVRRTIEGLDLGAASGEASMARYEAARSSLYGPYVEARPHLMENYLVNYVLASLFPFGPHGSFWDQLYLLVVYYALLKLHLVGVAAFEGRMDDALAIEVIQSFQKEVEHSVKLPASLLTVVRGHGFVDLPHLVWLIAA